MSLEIEERMDGEYDLVFKKLNESVILLYTVTREELLAFEELLYFKFYPETMKGEI